MAIFSKNFKITRISYHKIFQILIRFFRAVLKGTIFFNFQKAKKGQNVHILLIMATFFQKRPNGNPAFFLLFFPSA